MGRIGKSRRRRQARQSAMEPLLDNISNDASQAETNENVLEPSSMQASEDLPETCGPSNMCNVDTPSRAEQGETSPMLDFAAKPLEQQAARFEEYALPAMERLHLLPPAASLLKSVWREVTPYQVYTLSSTFSVKSSIFRPTTHHTTWS